MKCTIPEISWHNRDPVLSIDIQPKKESEPFYRMASGGTDSHVLIWQIVLNSSGTLNLECVSDLTRHQKAVNVVRFSPSGEFLASGDDESTVIVWRQRLESDAPELVDDTVQAGSSRLEENKEHWTQFKFLRGHLNDVYDLAWCHDSSKLISGSVDNTAVVWDVQRAKKIAVLADHKNFVQGVAWDPKNQYLATMSSDGICRVFCAKSHKAVSKASRSQLPWLSKPTAAKTSPTKGEAASDQGGIVSSNKALSASRLFHDDTLKTFYRRLTFTPDGELLIVPAGFLEPPQAPASSSTKPTNATWIFSRRQLSTPVMYYPTLKESSMVVKCCPVMFTLRQGQVPVIMLPYRVVIAVATKSAIFIYDTQHAIPIALISNIHYTKLTDLSWSSDGRVLVASSTDGYCSLITFAPGELGDEYKEPPATPQTPDEN